MVRRSLDEYRTMHFTAHSRPFERQDLQQVMQIGLIRAGVQRAVCELSIHHKTGHIIVDYGELDYEFHDPNIHVHEVLEALDLETDRLQVEWSERGLSTFDTLLACVRDVGLTSAVFHEPDILENNSETEE